jgi:hypothetical protein
MKSISKGIVKMAILSALSVMPLAAQIVNGVDFTTSFPFYAGNAKMPAGSYKLTKADFDENVLLIESTDGTSHSAFIDFRPTQAEQPHAQGDVTFHKYGNTEYLNRIWVEGQTYGMKVEPTKAEQNSASVSTLEEHSLAATKR